MGQSSSFAPIVLFCYNRPWHLRQTIASLQLNTLAPQSELFIYSDGPKTAADDMPIEEIRVYISGITGFKKVTVVTAEKNKGLAKSIIDGVTQVVKLHGKIIVLEDDMLTTPDFLNFINEALNVYESRQDIFSVSAYTPPILIPENYKQDLYLASRASSWGWATWAHKWEMADWEVKNFEQVKKNTSMKTEFCKGGSDLWPMLQKQQMGVIDSWAIRWTFAQYNNQAYGLYPVHSKIKNIGTDGTGTNFTFKSGQYGSELATGEVVMDPELKPDPQLVEVFRNYYNLPLAVKIKNWVKYRI
jgi:hypothetical protein